MIIPTITDPIVDTRTIPADTSLAILADFRCSVVIRSVIDSIAVFIISAEKTKTIVKTIKTHSSEPIDN